MPYEISGLEAGCVCLPAPLAHFFVLFHSAIQDSVEAGRAAFSAVPFQPLNSSSPFRIHHSSFKIHNSAFSAVPFQPVNQSSPFRFHHSLFKIHNSSSSPAAAATSLHNSPLRPARRVSEICDYAGLMRFRFYLYSVFFHSHPTGNWKKVLA
jgi:hypothetical protein